MYFETIQQFIRTLSNMDNVLVKATHHAERREFDPDLMLGLRMAPDMFPLTKQLQVATDVAKAAVANLTGKVAPKFEDNEKTMADVRERLRKTMAYLEEFKAEDFAKVTPKSVCKLMSGKSMLAPDYLLGRAVPNFFFHTTTTYNLLRAAGVEVGKSDFLGNLATFE